MTFLSEVAETYFCHSVSSATLRTLSFCISYNQQVCVTVYFSFDYADLFCGNIPHRLTPTDFFFPVLDSLSPRPWKSAECTLTFSEGLPNSCEETLEYEHLYEQKERQYKNSPCKSNDLQGEGKIICQYYSISCPIIL